MKSGGGFGLGELTKVLRFPYNISATAGASDFKLGEQLGLPKAHHNHTQKKRWACPELGELPKIRGFPFSIYTVAEASDFKFGTQLGFAKAYHKITHRKNWHGLGLGELLKISRFTSIFTPWLKMETSNLVHSLGLPRSNTKPRPEENVGVDLGCGNSHSPYIWGSPLIFLQLPRCPLSCPLRVSGASCHTYANS